MPRLLWSEFEAVGNAVRLRGARAPLFGTLLTLILIAALSHLFGSLLVSVPETLQLLRGDRDVASLMTWLLTPTSLVSVWFGLAASQRQLFEAKDLDLVLTAPITATRVVFLVFFRIWCLTTVYSAALIGPTAWHVLDVLDADAGPRWTTLAAVALATGAPLGIVMGFTITMLRWFSGRGIRIVLTLVVGALSVAFSLFLLTAAFGRRDQAEALVRLAQNDTPRPWMIDAGGNMVAASLGEPWQHDAVLRGLGFFALALIALYFMGLWYPRAVELSRLARKPSFGLGLKRPWPERPVAALRRKEFARLLQEPRQLFGMLLYGLMLFLAARSGLIIDVAYATPEAPPAAQDLLALLVLWFLGALMALPANFSRFALADGKQWGLYMTAPIRPSTLLWAKLHAATVMLFWPLAVVAVLGLTVLHVESGTLWTFLGLGLSGTVLALSILAPLATLPMLVKPFDDGTAGQHGRTLFAVFGLVFLFEVLVAIPALVVWVWLCAGWRIGEPPAQPGTLALLAVGGGAGYALLLAGISCLWTRRNTQRLLAAR